MPRAFATRETQVSASPGSVRSSLLLLYSSISPELVPSVAVGKTPGEPAGSLVRASSENRHLVRRTQPTRRERTVHGALRCISASMLRFSSDGFSRQPRRRPALRAWALIASVSHGSRGAPPSTRLRHSQRPTVGGRSVSQTTRNRGPGCRHQVRGLAVSVRGRSRRGPRWARRSGRSSRCGSPGASRPEEFPAS
jgi:hypothetical protein